MAVVRKKKRERQVTSRKEAQDLDRTPDELWRSNPEVIRRFLDVRGDYEQLCAEVEYILRKRIAAKGIETSAIISRAKTLKSFREKLKRKHYDDPFKELADLAGARVVCLYRDDIEKVAKIIKSEFEVVEDVNKLDELDVNQFGYSGRHFVVRLGKTSSGARYDDLKGLACEIQVRTVTQDAWAIIQHHLVYKRESHVPKELRRRLSRLAGVFETVDDQYESIRKDRDAYLADLHQSASASKPDAFLDNELNLDTFKEYLAWAFPGRPLESWDGQARVVLDELLAGEHKTLRTVAKLVKDTDPIRRMLVEESPEVVVAVAGKVPSSMEPLLAMALTTRDWARMRGGFAPGRARIIEKHRARFKSGEK